LSDVAFGDTNYELNADGRFDEELAQILGVPFEVIPFKARSGVSRPKRGQRHSAGGA